jgi:hypothetical protein
MKSLIDFSFLFLSFFSFSQEKMSYYFDYYSISNYKNYGAKLDNLMVNVLNEKDSTYTLLLNYSSKEATLNDRKNRQLIKFVFDFKFEKIEDLNKLTNPKLYTQVQTIRGRRFKKFVEDFEYENDSLTGKTIVHLTSYRKKKRKKIINEHYYYFGDNVNTVDSHKKSIKNYLLNKYKLKDLKNLNIEKVLHLKDGKIESQIDFVEIKKVDFNFKFEIEEVYPKRL